MSNRSDIAAQNMQAYLGGNVGGAEATPSYETPTPTPAADYGSYQDNTNNPYDANNTGLDFGAEEENKNKGQEALEQASTESQKPAQPEQPKESFSQESLNNVLTQNGVTSEEWSRITNPNFDIQGLMSSNAPEAQKYRNAYMAYQNMMQTPAQQTPAPAQAPAQTPTPAPAQNPILPSAGGNYQADEIYDPSKTYGRQADGSYVYSSSAAQLQRDLNRVMNAGLAVDGYFGEKTQQALNEYLAQNGKPENSVKGDESYKMFDEPIGPSLPQGGMSSAASQESTKNDNQTEDDRQKLIDAINDRGRSMTEYYQVNHTPSERTETSAYWDANRPEVRMDADNYAQNALEEARSRPSWNETPEYQALERQRQIDAINDRGRLQTDYYSHMLDDMQAEQPSGYSMNTPSTPTGNGAYSDANREEVHSPEGRASWTNAWTQTPEYQELLRQRQLEDIERAGRRDTDYYSKMLEDLQVPTTQESMTGNSMSAALENRQPDRTMPRGYATPATESLAGNSYSEALARATTQPDTNIFRQEMEELQGEMASNDIQSSATPTETVSPEEQAMRDAYANAMQSAGRARDIFNGLPTEAEQMQQAREQREQNMRTALENQFNNPYMQQFQRDFDQLKQQFPNYSNTALMDMILVNEEMRNGQSSYYKWLANSL